MADVDVLVLRRSIHGLHVEDLAARLRERLPDREVVHARTPEAERELVGAARVVVGTTPPDGLFAPDAAVELFACVFAGVDHLPLGAFAEHGVAVTNASGVHAPNASEWVLGQLLVFARGLHVGFRRQRRREFRHFQARELSGGTVAVVGMGAIGTAVLERLAGFGVDSIGVRHTPGKGGPADEVVGYDGFHDVLARTDYLVLACPLTGTTRGLVDRAALETLPPEAVLVNVARGEVVDTDALVSALRWSDVRGAALDVTDPEPLPPDHPLWTFENVAITPHVAGQTPEYYERLADVVAENVERLGRSGPDAPLRNEAELE